MTWAAERGYTHVRLWSDVKFGRSHVMYERLGFVRTGLGDCDDIDRSKEYRFEKPLSALATTARYLQVSRQQLGGIRSPLDLLDYPASAPSPTAE